MKNDITSDNSEISTIDPMNDQRSNQDEWMNDRRSYNGNRLNLYEWINKYEWKVVKYLFSHSSKLDQNILIYLGESLSLRTWTGMGIDVFWDDDDDDCLTVYAYSFYINHWLDLAIRPHNSSELEYGLPLRIIRNLIVCVMLNAIRDYNQH